MESTFEYIGNKGIFHGSASPLMGTRLEILTFGMEQKPMEEVWKRICTKGEELERLLSKTGSEGEVGRFNAGKTLSHTAISQDLCDILSKARDFRISTLGLYDVAIGKMNMVDLNEDQCTLSLYGATLDFGGYQKGLLLEYCREQLEDEGVKTAFADLGGSAMLCIGKHPFGDAWTIDLMNPYSRISIVRIPVCDRAVSISANGPGFSGRIINPKNGEPCNTRRIVAVTSPSPLEAKVLSTALMVAKKDEAEIIKERFPEAVLYCFDL